MVYVEERGNETMRRSLSILVKMLLVLMVCFCAVWGYLLYKIRQPTFQQRVIATVSERVGRRIEVDGGFDLSFAPLGIKLSGLTIKSSGNWQGQDFVKAGDFRLQVKLSSLIEGKVEVERILVKDFALNLLSDEKLGNNWSQWSDKDTKDDRDADSGSVELSVLQINSLKLENGVINLTENGKHQLTAVLARFDIRGLMFHNNLSPVKWVPSVLSQMDFVTDCYLTSVDWRGIVLKNLVIQATAHDSSIDLSNLTCDLFGSAKCELRGSWDLSQLPTKLTANWQIKQLQLHDLTTVASVFKNINGVISTDGQISSSFATPNEVARHLNGSGKLEVHDGAYEGIDIPYQIRRARDTIKKQVNSATDTKRTVLDLFTAQWSSVNGMVNLTKVTVDTPDCVMNGNGLVNLLQGTLDTKLSVQLKNDATINVPLNIRGTLANPEVSLDLGQLLKNQISNLIPRAVDIGLGKALGTESNADNGQENQVNSAIERSLGKLFGK